MAPGELADLIREFDWSATPVGSIDTWPQVLLSAVDLILAANHPMFIWWGEELTQFYNDPYRASLGEDKHHSVLGQAGRHCWPEIWLAIGPQIAAVMNRIDVQKRKRAGLPFNALGVRSARS